MLKHIVCDYLAIQGSATPSEHAFSSGGITGSVHRSCLSTDTFKALQILKGTYQNGHVKAVDEASRHMVDDLSDNENNVIELY